MIILAKAVTLETRRVSEGGTSLPRLRVGLLLSLAILLITASPALAQKTLRWKLKAGDQLQVNVTQQKTATTTIAGKPVKMTEEMTFETLWSVDSADEKQAKITQTVKRLAMKMQLGDAAPIAYDSAAKTAPVGTAKEIAAAVKPLFEEGSSLLVTMNTRGEVLSAEPSPKLAEHWKSPGKKEIDSTTQEMLKRPIILLPEGPVGTAEVGKTKWNSEREVEMRNGKVKQSLEFVYGGEAEAAGQKLDKIDFTSTLQLTPGGPKSLKLTLKEQKQTGHSLFSADLGRVVSAEQTQTLVTEAPYRETIITVAVESTVKTVISPVQK
ncbi:MAG: hypothetical protein K8R36_01600 [Planctomycetales bacterium]|nr:hypothetical protein [Planctomycetales bacterium]